MTPEEQADNEWYADNNNAMIIFKDRKYGIFEKEILFKFDYFSKRYYMSEEEQTREYSWVKKMKAEKNKIDTTNIFTIKRNCSMGQIRRSYENRIN